MKQPKQEWLSLLQAADLLNEDLPDLQTKITRAYLSVLVSKKHIPLHELRKRGKGWEIWYPALYFRYLGKATNVDQRTNDLD